MSEDNKKTESYELLPGDSKGSIREKLKRMREVDVRTVDRSTLVDIKDVKIDTSLPEKERLVDFIRQIKNPYCYLDNGIVVKVRFEGNKSLEDCLKHYIRTVER